MEYNPDKIRKITSEILGAPTLLEDLKRLPEKDFLADPHKVGSAKYLMLDELMREMVKGEGIEEGGFRSGGRGKEVIRNNRNRQ